jgi:phosphate-selective porin OprO/OprP
LLTGLACLLACAPAATAADESTSAYDRLWSHAQLYRNPGEGFLQSLALSGRLQADATWVDSNEGDFNDQTWRRFRFGFKAAFAGNWGAQLEGDFDLNESYSDWYERLTDAYISWKPGADTELKALKQSAGFTLDGTTSSKNLLTLERSNLTENLWFTAEYFTGLTLTGSTSGNWSYKGGIFSNDGDKELKAFDAGYFTLLKLGHDWARELGLDKAEITLDYVYQERDGNNNTPDLSNVLSVYTRWEQGPWGLWTDLSAGTGYGQQSDLWGASLMPFYTLSELLQLVVRYTYVDSDGDNGVRLPRYYNEVVSGRGDEYNELYAGLNVFFYGHKLKWQTGLQYADMSDSAGDGGETDGWCLTTGLRIFW